MPSRLFVTYVAIVALVIGPEFVARGQGICFDPAANYATGNGSYSVHAVDLDGDHDADLVVANMDGSSISVLMNNGNGTFGPATDYASATQPLSVCAADLDGDGDQDLAVAKYGSNNVGILMNNGNETFAAVVNYPAAGGP